MRKEIINGVEYKLPEHLTDDQKDIYVHLIKWKWRNITKEEGLYSKKNKSTGAVSTYEYDAILPESIQKNYPLIYPPVLQDMLNHKKKFDFKLHKHFNHMASSQVANVNLFLPILLNPKACEVLKQLKSDFKNLATDNLYKGFRIEYWDGNSNTEKGLLGDHNAHSGTDSDIAIAYYNKENELCLWLIEHKLTEKEFTECGGFKSKGRDKSKHLCEKSFSEIVKDKNLCYYHDVKKCEYWNITEANKSYFTNHSNHTLCPFKGGLNQLWRNQLMGFALENTGQYKHIYFSVVHHPKNTQLDNSIKEYKNLIGNNEIFTSFTSNKVVDAVAKIGDNFLDNWVNWYKDLYNV